jgi:hypothetical protein
LDRSGGSVFHIKYGDTTFNQPQLPLLIQELESIRPKAKDTAARDSLDSIIAFVRKAQNLCTPT